MAVGERAAVISGVGQSDIGRRLYRSGHELTIDSCLAALADGGLDPADIDGLATYPGSMDSPPGFSAAGVTEVQEALRLQLNWYSGGIESPGQLGSVITACAAVAAGYARHVLCFRSITEGSAQGAQGRASVTMGARGKAGAPGGPGGAQADAASPGGEGGSGTRRPAPRIGSFASWLIPYGAPSAANWIAMYAQRHFHEYGTTREQLAQLALNSRKNAALNPNAIYREPLTMADYLGARMISTPLCLFDCDVPCDGATAVIVSSAETAADLRRLPVRVEAIGSAQRGRNSWDQIEDLTTMACRDAGAHLWERTDLGPSDVDIAEVYDGFSFIALAWLEALGFCGRGEGGAFIEGGTRIALDGQLPVNTHGGQLSGGRLHGYGFLHEACTQLWAEAGERQVRRSGGTPQVAVVAAGGGPLAGALLLTSS